MPLSPPCHKLFKSQWPNKKNDEHLGWRVTGWLFLTIFIMYLNMKDEQLVLLFTTRLDKVLQNPLKRLAAANRRIWVAFAGLVHSYHHFRKRCVNGYWIHFLHWWARFFCHRVIWQNTFQPQITILKLQLNDANPDIDQETTGIVNKNLNNHSQTSTHKLKNRTFLKMRPD